MMQLSYQSCVYSSFTEAHNDLASHAVGLTRQLVNIYPDYDDLGKQRWTYSTTTPLCGWKMLSSSAFADDPFPLSTEICLNLVLPRFKALLMSRFLYVTKMRITAYTHMVFHFVIFDSYFCLR